MDSQLSELRRTAMVENTPEAWQKYAQALERTNQFDPLALLNAARAKEQQRRDDETAAAEAEKQRKADQEEIIRETIRPIQESLEAMFATGFRIKGRAGYSEVNGTPYLRLEENNTGHTHYSIQLSVMAPKTKTPIMVAGCGEVCRIIIRRNPGYWPSFYDADYGTKRAGWKRGHNNLDLVKDKAPNCFEEPHIEVSVAGVTRDNGFYCLSNWKDAVKQVVQIMAPLIQMQD